jgi:hypothetical protein
MNDKVISHVLVCTISPIDLMVHTHHIYQGRIGTECYVTRKGKFLGRFKDNDPVGEEFSIASDHPEPPSEEDILRYQVTRTILNKTQDSLLQEVW